MLTLWMLGIVNRKNTFASTHANYSLNTNLGAGEIIHAHDRPNFSSQYPSSPPQSLPRVIPEGKVKCLVSGIHLVPHLPAQAEPRVTPEHCEVWSKHKQNIQLNIRNIST